VSLRARLTDPRILVAPGVYDGLTAAIAEQAGFEALYLSGAAVAYTRLGRPDIGLTSVSEMADTMALIRDRVDLPVIIDADTGFGNALNAQRTMRTYERAGANALQVEDQTFPKRCGHLSDKSLIPPGEMVGKIAAMADARASDETLIIARTDAVAVEGFDAALDRAEAYVEAGAERALRRGAALDRGNARRDRAFRGPYPASGEHGGRRRDPDHRRGGPGGAGLFHRHLPRRHRSGAREDRGGLLRQPAWQWQQPALRRPDVRFRRPERAARHARDAGARQGL
jgi:isocitrate lyase